MKNENNIANCAARVFLILQKILKSNPSKSELLQGFSEDTLAIYLNTLESFGLEILYEKRRNSTYQLKESINFANFTDNHIKMFALVKEVLAQSADWNDVVVYNNLLLRFANFTDKKYSKLLENIVQDKPFGANMHEKIFQLQKYIDKKISLLVDYNSPSSSKNYFKILPKYLKLQNKRLYLWGFDSSINEVRYLRIERISDFKKIEETYAEQVDFKYAICEISQEEFVGENDTTEILRETSNKYVVKYHFENSFEFMQKIFSYGNDCKILEPNELREDFRQKLDLIRGIYERED